MNILKRVLGAAKRVVLRMLKTPQGHWRARGGFHPSAKRWFVSLNEHVWWLTDRKRAKGIPGFAPKEHIEYNGDS